MTARKTIHWILHRVAVGCCRAANRLAAVEQGTTISVFETRRFEVGTWIDWSPPQRTTLIAYGGGSGLPGSGAGGGGR